MGFNRWSPYYNPNRNVYKKYGWNKSKVFNPDEARVFSGLRTPKSKSEWISHFEDSSRSWNKELEEMMSYLLDDKWDDLFWYQKVILLGGYFIKFHNLTSEEMYFCREEITKCEVFLTDINLYSDSDKDEELELREIFQRDAKKLRIFLLSRGLSDVNKNEFTCSKCHLKLNLNLKAKDSDGLQICSNCT